MRKHLKIVEDNKASKVIRLANSLLDFIALAVVNLILYVIFTFLYNTTSIELFFLLNHGGFLWDMAVGIVVSFTYHFLAESLSDGKTFGKIITSTKVISIDGIKPSTKQYFLRSLVRQVPFDFLSFLGYNGWHDSWSDTRVISIKNYEAERQAKSDIESIGTKEFA